MRHRRQSGLASPALGIESLEDRVLLAAFSEFVDPNPNPDNQFGASMLPLSTGNVVITSPFDDAGGTDAGAVYLFNGATGALISTITGSGANDRVGSSGVTALSNGNFVIRSSNWFNGSTPQAGAVTFGNGSTGVSGVVSASNSLIGTSFGDRVGERGVTALTNGNYVVQSPFWSNGSALGAGAVTFGNGTTGVSGAVSASNSLVGTTTDDQIGAESVTGILVLSNGNYVVQSYIWDNGAIENAGAVTFGSGTTGVTGEVSASNSLVGSSTEDRVGVVKALTNGNYVVSTSGWDNGAVENAGAVTLGDGTTGISGTINATNSLVGTATFDLVGDDVKVLSTGNYVVISPRWANGTVAQAGAITFGDGTTGIIGTISDSNSLVGSTTNDRLGNQGTTVLSNGNYVVISQGWDNGTATDAGAVTFGSGTTGVSGAVGPSNSLVGTTFDDDVGRGGVTELSNGNYVVISWEWDNGAARNAGAVTFGSGTSGVSGALSASNSLVGTKTLDNVGRFGITPLTNGNYVVRSPNWDNGAIRDVGAATFGNGTTGVSGAVSASNSLVGTTIDDNISATGVAVLTNGNYVVYTRLWDNGAATDAGAVTFGNGTTGVSGTVSASNSLVGTTTDDRVSHAGVIPLSNGNYVIVSFWWNNGAATQAGAVTFGNGTTGVSGTVSASNSLVGTTASDRVGNGGVTALNSGSYVVNSGQWDNGAATDAGAVTFGNGNTGVSGAVSASNSLVGTTAFDRVGNGGVTPLSNGNYVVRSTNWDNVGAGANSSLGSGGFTLLGNITLVNAGAATHGNGATGVSGAIDQNNSVIGMSSNTNIQSVVVDDLNNIFLANFTNEDNGKVRVNSQGSPVIPLTPGNSVNGGDVNRSGIRELTLEFNESVTIAEATSLKLFNLTTGQSIDLGAATLRNNSTASVTWDLSGVTLPDGRYTAELSLAATTPNLAQTRAFVFHKLLGDLNGDGIVSFSDRATVNANFPAFGDVYGPGDANGDGIVSFSDRSTVNANFGNLLNPIAIDFGDAPDSATFPTTLANDGARHVITGNNLFLGISRDDEGNGQSSSDATGDDVANVDDEDSIQGGFLVPGTSLALTVMASVPNSAFLNGWIDFNRDGDWDDAGEQVFTNVSLSDGSNDLMITTPAGASSGNTIARLRVTETAGYSYFGLAPNGEVEDYQLTIVGLFGAMAQMMSAEPADNFSILQDSESPLLSLIATPPASIELSADDPTAAENESSQLANKLVTGPAEPTAASGHPSSVDANSEDLLSEILGVMSFI